MDLKNGVKHKILAQEVLASLPNLAVGYNGCLHDSSPQVFSAEDVPTKRGSM